MKAFLLAAGVGSRLRPITDTIPKCLLEFAGQSLLDRWMDSCDRAGVDEVLVNLHHLPDLVRQELDRRTGPPKIVTSFEPQLLGSAGTLLANRSWVEKEEVFLTCNVDNLTDFDLRTLIDCHRAAQTVASIVLFRSQNPSECGVVDVDATGTMTGFTEKPVHPTNDLANAGIYAFHPAVLDELTSSPPLDIGYDLLPKLMGRASTLELDGYFLDIGTRSAYHRALNEWSGAAVR